MKLRASGDSMRLEMIDEILEDIHHVWRDIVEGDRAVATGGKASLLGVVAVFRVPVGIRILKETFFNSTWLMLSKK